MVQPSGSPARYRTCPTWQCAAALLLGLFAAGLPGTAQACEKTVNWRANSAPISWQAANGTVTGMGPDFMREALRRLGCNPRFVETTWARAMVDLEGGDLDLLPGAHWTEERARIAHFSRPVLRSPSLLFVHQRAAHKYAFKHLSDLIGSDFRLGALHRAVYGPDYDALKDNPAFTRQITYVSSLRSAWKMIEANRLDGMIADEITAMGDLSDMGLTNVVVPSTLVVTDEPIRIAMSRKSIDPDFVARFDRAINDMIRDGSYVAIVQKYLPCKVSAAKLGCRGARNP